MMNVLGRIFSAISAVVVYQILVSTLNLDDIVLYPAKISASHILIAALSLIVLSFPGLMIAVAFLVYVFYIFPETYLFRLLSALTGMSYPEYSIMHTAGYAFTLSFSYLGYHISNSSGRLKNYLKKLEVSGSVWIKSTASAFLAGVLATGLSITGYALLTRTGLNLAYPVVFLGIAVVGIIAFLSIIAKSLE